MTKKNKISRRDQSTRAVKRFLDEVEVSCKSRKKIHLIETATRQGVNSIICSVVKKMGIIEMEEGQNVRDKRGCFFTWRSEKSLDVLAVEVWNYKMFHYDKLPWVDKEKISSMIEKKCSIDEICAEVGRCQNIVEAHIKEIKPEKETTPELPLKQHPVTEKEKSELPFIPDPDDAVKTEKKPVTEAIVSSLDNFQLFWLDYKNKQELITAELIEVKACLKAQQKQMDKMQEKVVGTFNRTGSIFGMIDKTYKTLKENTELKELNSSTLERVTNSFDLLVSELPNIKRMAVILANVKLPELPVLGKKKN